MAKNTRARASNPDDMGTLRGLIPVGYVITNASQLARAIHAWNTSRTAGGRACYHNVRPTDCRAQADFVLEHLRVQDGGAAVSTATPGLTY